MKRGLSRLHIAAVVAMVALVVSVFPATSLAEGADRWPPYPSANGSSYGCFHAVRFGETLSSIAVRYGTSMFGLMQANAIQNANRIFAGMFLRVPCTSSNYSAGYSPQCYSTAYIVQPGDDLFRIGLRYNMSPIRLALYNGLRNPDLIFPGMRLVIPCSTGYSPQPYPTLMYSTPAPMSTPVPGQATVVMRNIAFNPGIITVHAGQTVMWQNQDSASHTTTSGSCPGGTCTPMPGWDSGTLNPGQSFSHTFNTTGTFTYYCKIHGAMMQGTVVVMP